MSFAKIKISTTFVSEFNRFIDSLIEQQNYRYIGGWIEAIDEIIKENSERYHSLADDLLEKIESKAKSGMLGSSRREQRNGIEYGLSFDHGSFAYTLTGYVQIDLPEEIELIDFQFHRK